MAVSIQAILKTLRIQRQYKDSLPKSWQNGILWTVHSTDQTIQEYLLYTVPLKSHLKENASSMKRM